MLGCSAHDSIDTDCAFFSFSPADDEGRPKLNLKPRTVDVPINALADTKQSAAIFGAARPRDEKPETAAAPEEN